MRKFIFTFSIIACIVFNAQAQVSVWNGSHSTWTNGSGTQSAPYLIENAAQLAHLAYTVNNSGNAANYVDTCFKLMTDIDLNGSAAFQWSPIGYYISSSIYSAFNGNFDGNNHAISNLYINTSIACAGLFGCISKANISNLAITDSSSIRGTSYAGSIVGYIRGSALDTTTITNCSNTGVVSFMAVSSSSSSSGGIVGYGTATIAITNCYNTGTVSSSAASYYVTTSSSGGIVGSGTATITIMNCYNTGTVSSSTTSYSATSYSGGIVGYGTATITNCYNTGAVSSSTMSSYSSYSSYSGGIVGYGTATIAITNCYNTGAVSSDSDSDSDSDSHSGGIVGYNYNGTITNCYNTGAVSSSSSSSTTTSYSSSYSGGIVGYNYNLVTITNCYNTGAVSSSSSSFSFSGGIAGFSGTITNCYNIGTIIAIGSIISLKGGIKGEGMGTISNSYYLTTCGGTNTYGGVSMTSTAMQASGFLITLNNGQNPRVWDMDYTPPMNGGYLILSWQPQPLFITTLGASNITQNTVTLNGKIVLSAFPAPPPYRLM
jgi:hypothetical protein